MRVTELARAGGVTAETVRHYTREGLLQPQRDPYNGYQYYGVEALGSLRFIDCLRSLGVGIPAIKQILSWADKDRPAVIDRCKPLAEQRHYIRTRIQELQAIALWLDSIDPDDVPDNPGLRQLIEALGSMESTTITDGSRISDP